MDTKFLVLLSVIGLSFVLVAPTVYGAVEPHFLITMESGQTTKPFQIKDSAGTEIFSISTIGDILPSNHHTPTFTFRSTFDVVTSIGVDVIEATPLILLRVELFDPEVQINQAFYITEVYIQADMRTDSGIDDCVVAWVYSENGGNTWTSWTVSAQDNNLTFIQEQSGTNQVVNLLVSSASDFGFAIFNADGATTCSFRNMVGYAEFILADGETVTEVTP